MRPKPKGKGPGGRSRFRKLSRLEWAKAEERYKQGDTQAEIAKAFDIRVETVSRHMTKNKVKGGEKMEKVREEIEAAVTRRKKEFASQLAKRKIMAKEQTYMLVTALQGLFIEDLKNIKEKKGHIHEIAAAGKALREAIGGVREAYDAMKDVLGITPDDDKQNDLPRLEVVSMTEADEEVLRNARALNEDEEDEDLVDPPTDPAPDPAEVPPADLAEASPAA